MSILTITDVRDRCKVDPASHCWIWQGAAASDGVPRIHTLDYARAEKRTMSGPLAVWHIAHGEPPRPGHLVYRGCQSRLCLNPAHLRQAASKAEIGLHIRRLGSRKGTCTEKRIANLRHAQAAAGVIPTPTEKMLAAGFKKNKSANLSEAYEFFTGQQLVGAHSALTDVDACMKVFFAIEDGVRERVELPLAA